MVDCDEMERVGKWEREELKSGSIDGNNKLRIKNIAFPLSFMSNM